MRLFDEHRCGVCKLAFYRVPVLARLLKPEEQETCFECLMSATYTEGQPWKMLITGITAKATYRVPGSADQVRIEWGAFLPDLDLWLCGLSNKGTGHIPKEAFNRAMEGQWK